jgi:hypothetical protein
MQPFKYKVGDMMIVAGRYERIVATGVISDREPRKLYAMKCERGRGNTLKDCLKSSTSWGKVIAYEGVRETDNIWWIQEDLIQISDDTLSYQTELIRQEIGL